MVENAKTGTENEDEEYGERRKRRYRKSPAFCKRLYRCSDGVIRRQAAVLAEFMDGEELVRRIASIHRLTSEAARRILAGASEEEKAELRALARRINRRIELHAEENLRRGSRKK